MESLDTVCEEELGIGPWDELGWLFAIGTVEESAIKVDDEEEILRLFTSDGLLCGGG